jgi:hypothetical protein
MTTRQPEQLPLDFVEETRGELGWTRIFTRFLPDGRVYGIKEASLDTWGGMPSHLSMTQTAWDGYKREIAKHPVGSWNWECMLRWVGMGQLVRKHAGSGIEFSPDDIFFAVVPDKYWLKPLHAYNSRPEPLAEVLKIGAPCPAISHLSRLQVIRRFSTRNVSANLCDACENCEDRSPKFVACTYKDAESRLYPGFGWGPESPDYPRRFSKYIQTDEYILSHWIGGVLWLSPPGGHDE